MVYEYDCKKCGVFTDNKPLSEYKEPSKCPKCGQESPRVIATAVPKLQTWKTF